MTGPSTLPCGTALLSVQRTQLWACHLLSWLGLNELFHRSQTLYCSWFINLCGWISKLLVISTRALRLFRILCFLKQFLFNGSLMIVHSGPGVWILPEVLLLARAVISVWSLLIRRAFDYLLIEDDWLRRITFELSYRGNSFLVWRRLLLIVFHAFVKVFDFQVAAFSFALW